MSRLNLMPTSLSRWISGVLIGDGMMLGRVEVQMAAILHPWFHRGEVMAGHWFRLRLSFCTSSLFTTVSLRRRYCSVLTASSHFNNATCLFIRLIAILKYIFTDLPHYGE